jgi:hypothetical protein
MSSGMLLNSHNHLGTHRAFSAEILGSGRVTVQLEVTPKWVMSGLATIHPERRNAICSVLAEGPALITSTIETILETEWLFQA